LPRWLLEMQKPPGGGLYGMGVEVQAIAACSPPMDNGCLPYA
jgi:hypothetical protein